MEFKKFAFEPEDGFRDTSFYEDSPSDAREILQRQHDMTRDYINSVVSALSSKEKGEGGSEYIGSPPIPGVEGDNIYAQLLDLKNQMTDYVGGAIPDGSITEKKLADGSVTGEKISSGVISDEHFRENAKIDISRSAENLNGYPAEEYCPLKLQSVVGGFRERITKEKTVSVKGKTVNGKRYMNQENGCIKVFDIEKCVYTENIDLSAYSKNPVFAFDDDENMYFMKKFKRNDKGIVSVYKYSDGEVTPVSEIEIMTVYNYSYELLDAEILNGNLYMVFEYQGSYIEISSIPLAELKENAEAPPFYTLKINYENVRIVKKNSDFYCVGKCFVGGNENEIRNMLGNVLDVGPGNLLLTSGDFVFINEENYPEITSASTFNVYQSFCYGNYLYVMKGGYIFRGRII